MKLAVVYWLATVAFSLSSAAGLGELKVLYVGVAKSGRAADYKAFLSTNVARIELADRQGFNPALAEAYDVVLVEWPQPGGQQSFPKKSPLGERSAWTKPTVLLGSAGLYVATTWDVKGGFG